MPEEGNHVQLRFQLGWEEEDEHPSPASTQIAPTVTAARGLPPMGTPLPPGAPFNLAFFGLSELEFERLHMDWHAGEITCVEVAGTHGPWVAEDLMKRWGPPGAWLMPSPQALPTAEGGMDGPATEADAAIDATQGGELGKPGDAEEDEASGLLSLWMAPMLGVPWRVQAAGTEEERPPFFTLARRVVPHLVQQGTPAVVLASALMERVWARDDWDYLMETEEYFERMGLPVDVDRSRATELQEQAQAVVEWLEAQLWEEFVDHLEGMVGETEQVRDARGQPTMSTQECDRWWQWAMERTGEAATPRSRSRSRDREIDAASFMEAGRGRPEPRPKSYPGKQRGRGNGDEPPRRGERRDRDGGDTGRRRQAPRSRSQRIAARQATSTATGSRDPMPAETRETRRLLPRSGRAPPMTVADATCFWLHTMGLRDGVATDDHRALDPGNHDNRVRALRSVRSEDVVVVVMTGLLRTMAMLVVELSQLMMVRVQPLLPREDDEVEVEVDDEEVWMQTSLRRGLKRSLEEGESMAVEEAMQREQREREGAARVAQQDDREREEAVQEMEDEALYRQHCASVYRDWEWWEMEHCPRPTPRRLRAVLTVVHGSSSESLSCSVPLARGRPVDLHVSLSEQEGEAPVTTATEGGGAAPSTVEGGVSADVAHQARYQAWRDGELSNHDVARELGEDMLGVFWAQWMVDSEDVEQVESVPAQGLSGPPSETPVDSEAGCGTVDSKGDV